MADTVSTTKDFRYDINALRAIAVIGVVLYHYHIGRLHGGFSGVDIFFVISGYLMTRIIITGMDKNKFSFADFYGRRLRRIVPALLFVLIAVTIAGFVFYFPTDYKVSEKNAAASALFLSNILYWQNTNYFAPASGDNVLLHTWSLSVEWQFYLIYPVLLLGLYKLLKGKKQHLVVFIITTLISFVGAILWTKADPTASFYLLPARAWEMLFGGIAFLGQDYIKSSKLRIGLAVAGYVIIAYCFFFLRSSMPWPGLYTMLPVMATFMIVIANCNFKLLNFPGVQFLGRISYSVYLWHWPIYVMAIYKEVDVNGIGVYIILAAALVLGYLSYTLIETRNYQSNPLILASASVVLILTVGLTLFNANHIMFKPGTVKIASYRDLSIQAKKKKVNKRSRCWISSEGNEFVEEECLNINKDKRNFLLLGDSHGLQFAELLRAELGKKNIHLLQATASGCYAVTRKNGRKRCHELMHHVYRDFVKNNAEKIDGVILCGNWVSGLKDTVQLLSDLKNTIAYLDSAHVKSIIVGQNETYHKPYPYISAMENEYNLKLSAKYLTKQSGKVNEVLIRNLKDKYIDVYNYGETPKPVNDVPYMSDRNHLSTYGAQLAMKKIVVHPGFAAMVN